MGRRSRKRRAGAASAGTPAPRTREEKAGRPRPAGYARGEARGEAIRARLRPLKAGERPRPVTVGAIAAGLLALGNLIAYVAGLKIDGERPALTGIVVYEALLVVAAAGMWRVRYWAVLGFQFMLGFLLVFLVVFLTRASSLVGVLVVLAIGIPAGALFWSLIRVMARIQMPEGPNRSA